jgi:hypothetical protein
MAATSKRATGVLTLAAMAEDLEAYVDNMGPFTAAPFPQTAPTAVSVPALPAGPASATGGAKRDELKAALAADAAAERALLDATHRASVAALDADDRVRRAGPTIEALSTLLHRLEATLAGLPADARAAAALASGPATAVDDVVPLPLTPRP